MHGARSITIPVDCQLAAGALWTTATVLMGWDIFGGPADLGRAAMLIGLVAACVTTNILVKHHRRVVLEVMSYEFRLRDEEQENGVLPSQRPRLLAGPQRTRLD